MEPIIKVENLGKSYIIGHQRESYVALRDVLANKARQVVSKTKNLLSGGQLIAGNELEEFWALKDINFEVQQGDRVGIIGRNGAGKSTLLKVLSRITEPTTGSIRLRGRVASLLEVGTGFHPELSGRENIYLNGAILGMSRAEVKKKFDEIVDFAGVEKFLDTPVKRYSSGMYVRLAFAVAAHLEPEILIVDEVLAVGDAEFQKKCLGKMEDVSKNHGRTVLFVSHNMGAIAQLCDNGIVLQNGGMLIHGKIDYCIKKYLDQRINTGNYINNDPQKTNKSASFKEIKLLDIDNNERNDFFYDEPIFIHFEIATSTDTSKINLFCMILDKSLKRIFAAESNGIKNRMTLKINPHFLVRGEYSLHMFLHIPQVCQIDVAENVCNFHIIDNGSSFLIHGDYDYGSVFGNCIWV